ncbi:hypothetical protein QLS71_012140 [Mariniflexile litorale]|uniref:Uncharacterized protein n=1 Tax=Mariniflexile litorale TaxID=3045158 RepID=A0AAU7ED56_9FLAO|nr:hypothetical protein [Mariniflexile sp. KMM 9835]MDQ8213465.1 hypothetical protein [Mariniflexile sp. KMM 9835]
MNEFVVEGLGYNLNVLTLVITSLTPKVNDPSLSEAPSSLASL